MARGNSITRLCAWRARFQPPDCKVRTRYSPTMSRGSPLVTPAKAGVRDRFRSRVWGSASSPLFITTRASDGDRAGLDWLARAIGSLGWNDGLQFGLRLTKRRPATSHIPPSTIYSPPTMHYAPPHPGHSEQRVGRLHLVARVMSRILWVNPEVSNGAGRTSRVDQGRD